MSQYFSDEEHEIRKATHSLICKDSFCCVKWELYHLLKQEVPDKTAINNVRTKLITELCTSICNLREKIQLGTDKLEIEDIRFLIENYIVFGYLLPDTNFLDDKLYVFQTPLGVLTSDIFNILFKQIKINELFYFNIFDDIIYNDPETRLLAKISLLNANKEVFTCFFYNFVQKNLTDMSIAESLNVHDFPIWKKSLQCTATRNIILGATRLGPCLPYRQNPIYTTELSVGVFYCDKYTALELIENCLNFHKLGVVLFTNLVLTRTRRERPILVNRDNIYLSCNKKVSKRFLSPYETLTISFNKIIITNSSFDLDRFASEFKTCVLVSKNAMQAILKEYTNYE